MPTHIDALGLARTLRAVYGRNHWYAPTPFGDDGWIFQTRDHQRSLIVNCADGYEDSPDPRDIWIHASLTGADDVPTYEELKMLYRAVYRDRWAYQVFAPPGNHVNIHGRALHLFGRADGKPALPDFTMGMGSI